jgi:hypothetical protein
VTPYGAVCVAIADVNDTAALSKRLAAVVRDPEPIAAVTARGQAFARALQVDAKACDRLEHLLKTAVRRRSPSRKRSAPSAGTSAEANSGFALTLAAARLLEEAHASRSEDRMKAPAAGSMDLPQARNVLAAVKQAIAPGDSSLQRAAAAIRLEIAIAEAENDDGASPATELDPLFRLRMKRWAMLDNDLARLRPVRDPRLRITTFDDPERQVDHPATSTTERVSFRQINKVTGNRLRQQLVDDETREPVAPEHKGRGYEVGKGQYLIVEDEELDAIEIESTRTIEIDRFVPRSRIDQRFFDTPYYVAPNEPVGQEAFAIIREAMRRKAMVALGRLVLSKRERVIALEPCEKGLLGTTLRYPYEVRAAMDCFGDLPELAVAPEMLTLVAGAYP